MNRYIISQAIAEGGSADELDFGPAPGSSFINDGTLEDDEDDDFDNTSTQHVIDLIGLNNSPDAVVILDSDEERIRPSRRIFIREEDEEVGEELHDEIHAPRTSTPRRLFAGPSQFGHPSSAIISSPDAKRRCIEVQTTPSIGNNNPLPALNASQTEEEAVQCPICLEGWTTTGEHRFVSLKCGHCFGRYCIEKWLAGKQKKDKKCPTCNNPSKITDIRPIYARSLRAHDNSELNKALDDLEETKCKLLNIEKAYSVCRRELRESQHECEALKTQLIKQQQLISGNQRAAISKPVQPVTSMRSRMLFALSKKIEVCTDATCRALSYSSLASTLAVTQRSTNPIFPGYGVKLMTQELVIQDFLNLHTGIIKDLVFKPDDQLLLSASLDKSMKVSSLVTRKPVCIFQLEQQAWSCCWNETKTSSCYVGLKDGTIIEYDVRYNNSPLKVLPAFDRLPLISIQYVKPRESANDFSGIHCTSLSSTCFYELSHDREIVKPHSLPFEGKFLPGYYDNESGYALISTRPSTKSANVTHNVKL